MIKGKIFKRHAAFTCALLLSVVHHFGQQANTSRYPQDYFRNPLGIPMSLTANFGELRLNHWHMGFDLRTQQRENLSVYAAADGYVAHIGIRPLSFGRFMIINHPNGYSTLYAHLNKFYPELENFVNQKQSEKESWTIELDFSEKMFRVKKGDIIAKSGNTGGSEGPHLHFEIHDIKSGKSLNTSLFGFDIRDNIPPEVKQLAIYDRSKSTYQQIPQLQPAVKTDKGFVLKKGKIITGLRRLSFAIDAFDRVNGSAGKNGIYGAILYFDGVPQIQYLIDNIDYDETGYVNAHIDKKIKYNSGPYLQHLSRLPGFKGSVYTNLNGSGILELKDNETHAVKIEIFDARGNRTALTFTIQHNDGMASLPKKPNESKQLSPGLVNILEEKGFEAFMPEDCFYDTLPLKYTRQTVIAPGAVSDQHTLNDPQYPVHSSFTVRIKPTAFIPETDKDKLVVQREWKNKRSTKKAKWQNGWLSAMFSDFGNFQLFADKEAPELAAPVREKDTMDFSPLKKIVLTPTDNFGIKSFRAELDGKWLKFSNDKGKNFIYIFDGQCPFGIHNLKVRVEDIVGNVTEKNWWFKRQPYTPPPKKKR